MDVPLKAWHSEDHEPPGRPEPHYTKPPVYKPDPMSYVMYLHHEVYPQPPSTWRFLCGCGYTVFKANTRNILVSNDIGLPWAEYQPSANMIEIRCHNCKSTYKVLFQ